jgi:uncharacterized protein YyaL (SSP411 family)
MFVLRTFLALLAVVFFVLSSCQSGKKEKFTNRLAGESSLYLKQHAHNPVDWYPWGEEAMNRAKTEGKMLLISIGYASCHWCHVMEEETFSDTAVARFMNDNFVCVKVDREERPDVDDIYMAACQFASDSPCGWPLNAFATHDGRPIWAGTYYPKKEWVEILGYFAGLYREDPQKVFQYANELTKAVSDLAFAMKSDGISLDPGTLSTAAEGFKAAADVQLGGKKGAPKFPMPNAYSYLLAYHFNTPDPALLQQVHTTLRNLARGGIYDHLSGGFARYSVDIFWKVPHFEKMLYDNAQLVSLYSQAYRLSPDEEYARVIRQTLDFIEREMTSEEGGFYSSIDADSEGEEGAFYVWTMEEAGKALGDEHLLKLAADFYQLTPAGNWEAGKNVLFAKNTPEAYSREKGLDPAKTAADLEQVRAKLLQARSKRSHPRLDEKVITSWNALMLEAYAEAWRALGEEVYLRRAIRNASLISEQMKAPDGGLYRTASIPAFLDDYAFAIRAFIALYEVTFDRQWLDRAEQWMAYTDKHFWDGEKGVYFYSSDDHDGLVARRAEINDNVIPSSNSVMARNCFLMERFFPGKGYEEKARSLLSQAWPSVSKGGDLTYYANWSRLYLDLLKPPFEVAVVGPGAAARRDSLQRLYLPDVVWMGAEAESELDLLAGKYRPGKTLIFVCRNRVCQLPVEHTTQALSQMKN